MLKSENVARSPIDARSVAVIGASDDINRVGGRPIHYMDRYGFKGTVYPINPSREQVQGLPCFSDLKALPETPDLAIIALKAELVSNAVRACGERGISYAVIMSSGFAETGTNGRAAEDELVALAHKHGVRLMGPNAQGIANFATGLIANFSTMFMEIPPEDGPVAIISQSGAASVMPYAMLRQRGYGVRYLAASGNDADLTTCDLIDAVLDDEGVRVILLYIENLKNAPALSRAFERARAQGVPIIALHAGGSSQGQLSAASHTGAMATETAVAEAYFRRHGVWRVNGFRELVEAVPLYLGGTDIGTGRTLIMSHSGAVGVVCADAAERLGLPLASLGPGTVAGLEEVAPSFATVQNPVDLTAGLLGQEGMFESALALLADEPGADVLHVGIPVAGPGYDISGFADAIAQVGKRYRKLITLSAPQDDVRSTFTEKGIPTFDDELTALRAIAQVTSHRQLRDSTPPPETAGRNVLPPAGLGLVLDEIESLAVLYEAEIPVTPHVVCRSAEEAVSTYSSWRVPVVVKGCSADTPHKSEHGLVRLSLDTPEAVREAAKSCLETLKNLGAAGRLIVAPMQTGRRELVVGARRDPAVGPIVMIGDGGKYVEALKDYRLLVAPFTPQDVVNELRSLRIWPILEGVRGEEMADIEAVASLAVQLGELMVGSPKIESVDMNPVLVRDAGDGASVVDALVTFVEGEA